MIQFFVGAAFGAIVGGIAGWVGMAAAEQRRIEKVYRPDRERWLRAMDAWEEPKSTPSDQERLASDIEAQKRRASEIEAQSRSIKQRRVELQPSYFFKK